MSDATPDPAAEFGAWVRKLRDGRGVPLRVVAAAVETDTALLSNIERGQRLPTEACGQRLAAFFKVDAEDFQSRLLAVRLWRDYGASAPARLAAAAARIHEDPAAYGVNKSVNKRANKK